MTSPPSSSIRFFSRSSLGLWSVVSAIVRAAITFRVFG
jgi:hypothetical protein